MDGVRAIGCLLVLILHATQNVPAVMWLSGNIISFGRLGVLLLVMQGGYLVPRLMAHDPRPGRFWIGRAIRFYPVYWVVLALFVLILAVTGDRVPDLSTLLRNGTYFPEALGAEFVMRNTWTMAYVLACYGFVSLAMLAFRRASILKIAIGGSLLLSAVCLLAVVVLHKDPAQRASTICAFLAGMVLREARERSLSLPATLGTLGLTCAPILVAIPGMLSGEFHRTGLAYVVAAFFTAIIIQVIVGRWNPKVPKPLLALSGASYSIYLVQAPALLPFQNAPDTPAIVLLRIGASLAAGFLLFRFVEKPFSEVARTFVRRGRKGGVSPAPTQAS